MAAVIDEFVDQVAGDAEAALQRTVGGASAFTELIRFLDSVFDASASIEAVKAVAGSLGAAAADAASIRRATDALGTLIGRAQDQGQIRADLTIEDLYLLMGSAPVKVSRPARRRWLALVTEGLAVRGGRKQAMPSFAADGGHAG